MVKSLTLSLQCDAQTFRSTDQQADYKICIFLDVLPVDPDTVPQEVDISFSLDRIPSNIRITLGDEFGVCLRIRFLLNLSINLQ